MAILQWEDDAQAIVGRLHRPAILKLCCKTINEPDFVRNWVAHHAGIVGHDNLIIADNGSTDPDTLAFYEEVSDRVTVFQFRGHHNEIHWHPRFGQLFACIKDTSHFFCFVDVDERLVWIDEVSWKADASLLECLVARDSIYPTTWLINAFGRLDRFTLLDTEGRPILANNLRWGKPILPSALVASQSGIHNTQFGEHRFSTSAGTHLFLLHYTQFPEQRIRTNMQKLRGRGLVDGNAAPESVLGMDFSNHPDKTVLRFQREIKMMLSLSQGDGAGEADDPGFVTLGEGGVVSFSDETTHATFSSYCDTGPETIRSRLGS